MRELVNIEKLTPQDMATEYRVDSLAKAEKEIRYLIEKLHGISRASLVLIFESGRRLSAVKATLDHGQFLPWLEQNFSLTPRTARNYMKLYERFRGEPAALLEDLSIQEAYVMAGVLRAAESNAGADDDDAGKLQYAGKRDLEAERANMVAVFKKPTLSGRMLKNHRVENVGGRIYVYRKDVGAVAPALDLYLGKPIGLPEPDWIEMQEAYVIATELYLSKIEAYEAEGRLEPPEDSRLLSVIEKQESKRGASRRVGPGYDEGTALPAPDSDSGQQDAPRTDRRLPKERSIRKKSALA